MSGDEVLTCAEVAAELRCTSRTVTNLIVAGRLSAFRVGRNWRVTRSALEAFKRGEVAA